MPQSEPFKLTQVNTSLFSQIAVSKPCLQPHSPHREVLPWHLWLFCENPASGTNCFIGFVSSDVGTKRHEATPPLSLQSIQDSCTQHLMLTWSKKSVPCISWNLLISKGNYSASIKMHESDVERGGSVSRPSRAAALCSATWERPGLVGVPLEWVGADYAMLDRNGKCTFITATPVMCWHL